MWGSVSIDGDNFFPNFVRNNLATLTLELNVFTDNLYLTTVYYAIFDYYAIFYGIFHVEVTIKNRNQNNNTIFQCKIGFAKIAFPVNSTMIHSF